MASRIALERDMPGGYFQYFDFDTVGTQGFGYHHVCGYRGIANPQCQTEGKDVFALVFEIITADA